MVCARLMHKKNTSKDCDRRDNNNNNNNNNIDGYIEDSLTKLGQQEVRSERLKELEHKAERINVTPRKTQRALDLARETRSFGL